MSRGSRKARTRSVRSRSALALAALFSVSTAAADVTVNGLQMYLRADNVNGAGTNGSAANTAGLTTWTDLAFSGGSNTATLNNFALTNFSGWQTSGGVSYLEFSGDSAVNTRGNDYVTWLDPGNSLTQSPLWSYDFWLRDDWHGTDQTYLKHGRIASGDLHGFAQGRSDAGLGLGQSSLGATYVDGSVKKAYSQSTAWTRPASTTYGGGTLRHVAYTYDGSTLRTYINGAFDYASSATIDSIGTSPERLIGAKRGPSDAGLDDAMRGGISVVRGYNRPLSPSEIQANYNAGVAAVGDIVLPRLTPRPPKIVTVVEAGFNSPDTVYLGTNVAQLAPKGFDGISTWIAGPSARIAEGRLVRPGGPPEIINEQFIWPGPGVRLNPNNLTAPIADMQPTKSTSLNKNYLAMYFSNYTGPMNWFDDGWWSDINYNGQQLTRFAAQSGMKGLLMDPEMYADYLWDFQYLKNADPSVYGTKTWEEVRAKVRQRGREFIQAANQEMPDVTIFLMHGYYAMLRDRGQPNELPYGSRNAGDMQYLQMGLLGPFIDGMLEASTDETVIVDGANNGWLNKTPELFQLGKERVLYDPIELGFTEVPDKYLEKMRLGYGLYLDSQGVWDPDNPQNNHVTPAALEQGIEWALEYGDGYVWFWNERPNFFLPANTDWYRGQSLAVHPDYVTAILNAKGPAPQWNFNGNGNWSDVTKWSGIWDPVPNTLGEVARFGSVITGARTVTVDAPHTVGFINFTSSNSYTIAGTHPISIDNTTGSLTGITVTSGNHTIAAPLIFKDNSTIHVAIPALTLTMSGQMATSPGVTLTKTGNGTLLTKNVRAHGLVVQGGIVRIASDGTSAGASRANSLTVATRLDLTNNDLIVDGGSYNAIQTLVMQGFNGGNWLGGGITSSAAANDTSFVTTLGIVNNANVGYSDFAGFTDLNGDEILVKFTYYGDADLGGTVNLDDFNQFLFGFNPANAAPQIWLNGDFNYTGSVNLDDFNLFLFGLANQGGALVSPELFAALSDFVQAEGVDVDLSAVPEPAGAALLGLTFWLLRRRRPLKSSE